MRGRDGRRGGTILHGYIVSLHRLNRASIQYVPSNISTPKCVTDTLALMKNARAHTHTHTHTCMYANTTYVCMYGAIPGCVEVQCLQCWAQQRSHWV